MASMYCIAFAAFISVTAVSGYGLAHLTSVACENGHANLNCPPGSTISISHATYGRTDRSTCRNRAMGNTHCHAGNSQSIASSHCNGHQSCSIHASNGVFGDPCRGTHKYLKVNYLCNPSYHHEPEPLYHYYDESKDEGEVADEEPDVEDEEETEEDEEPVEATVEDEEVLKEEAVADEQTAKEADEQQ